MQRHGLSTLWRSSYHGLNFVRQAKQSCHHRHASTTNRPFRLAIVGSGPAGFYSAARVMSKIKNAMVDMYEQLPVPFGLVRFGVAPDHPEVKNCQDRFSEIASSSNFNFIGNVQIGRDISLSQLRDHYSAVLFTYGASQDRALGISGESTYHGIHSARAFVGWYNGLPENADLSPDLSRGDTAVIIGQGNVALDIARTLLGDIDRLRKTDITAQALDALSKSRIKRVHVVGRRGAMQASFTIKEVRELFTLPKTVFKPIVMETLPRTLKALPRTQRRMAELLINHSLQIYESFEAPEPGPDSKTWSLDFMARPMEFLGDADNHLSSIRFQRTAFAPDVDYLDPQAKVIDRDCKVPTYNIPASIAFRSIGYKSQPLPDMDTCNIPFDEKTGTIACDFGGRVLDASRRTSATTSGETIDGMYCAGWVKCGPTGVIAASMDDAFVTGDSIVEDWASGKRFLRNRKVDGWDALRGEIEKKGIRWVSWEDWRRIDGVERREGRSKGKEREKFVRVEDMLRVLE